MFFRKVKNLFRWLPIIWKDEDWDQHFIYEILKFKLKNQAKYIGGHDRHTSAKRDAEIMNLCTRLIDKVQEEYYSMEYLDYYKNNIKFNPIEGSSNFELKSEYISDTLNEYFNKYPLVYNYVVTKHDLVESDDHETKRKIAYYMSKVNHERARKLLFKVMERNIERWWD